MTLDDRRLQEATTAAATAIATLDVGTFDTPVPTCPGWTVADVIGHLSRVHGWAAKLLVAAPGEKVPWDGTWPGGPVVRTLLAGAVAESAAALATTDPDQEVFTWAGRRPARWWARRLAHETVLHAWDVTAAVGSPLPLDPAVAVDGIDELFGVYLGSPRRFDPVAMPPATWHLHATDVEHGEWSVTFDGEGTTVTREHAKGDLATQGTAADLLLLLWGRTGPEAVTCFGDTQILEHFRRAASF